MLFRTVIAVASSCISSMSDVVYSSDVVCHRQPIPQRLLLLLQMADMQLMSAIFRAYNDWFAKFRRIDPSPSGASMINLDDGEARDRHEAGRLLHRNVVLSLQGGRHRHSPNPTHPSLSACGTGSGQGGVATTRCGLGLSAQRVNLPTVAADPGGRGGRKTAKIAGSEWSTFSPIANFRFGAFCMFPPRGPNGRCPFS